MQHSPVSILAAATLALAGAAHAETLHYKAALSGASEVPSVSVKGAGLMSADLDTGTRKLTYRLAFSDLTGPADGAHIHGPAAAGANASPIVMLGMGDMPAMGGVHGMGDMHMVLKSPVVGSQILTPGQMAQLKAGQWYVNVHTEAHSDGEIRGQLLPAKP